MKQLIYIVIITTLFACKKNETPPDDVSEYCGTVSILKNEQSWDGQIGAFTLNDKGQLRSFVHRLNGAGFVVEELAIFKIPYSVGIHPLVETQSFEDDDKAGARYTFLVQDGHVSYGTWFIEDDSSAMSFIEIESINELTREISGRFHVELQLDSNLMDPRLSDTEEQARTIFSEGEFTSKIIQ
jgi:hypothetical protein